MRGKVAGHKGPAAMSFRGRAGRQEWLITTGFSLVAASLASAVPTAGPALALFFLVGALAVTTRRLHDLNRSGWFLTIPLGLGLLGLAAALIVPIALRAFGSAAMSEEDARRLGGAWALIIICAGGLLGLALGVLPGGRGPNRYGEAD